MYSTIVFMYRKYSENYHDVLNHCIYVQEVQRKLSRCTRTFYLCTESTVQTITMYLNIGFMYMRCYSATITLHSTIVFMYRKYSANYHDVLKYWIYVYEVLQRKLSPCTQPCIYLCTWCATAQTITICFKLYLFTRSTAQTLAIVFMYRRCYSANYHYVLNYCIYVQEVLQRKISLCTQTLYLCTGDARAQNITMYLNFVLCTGGVTAQNITMYLIIVFMYRRCFRANYPYVSKLCIYVQEVLQRKLSLCTVDTRITVWINLN